MCSTTHVPAAQYLRMSTEHQQYSLENQSAAIQRYANSHGFWIVQTYSRTAGRANRVHSVPPAPPPQLERPAPQTHPRSSMFWICMQYLIVSGFLPSAMWAGDSVIISATQQQERFLTCVAQISADDLRDTPNSNERLTVVILEHQKFLGMREAFHAHKTKLAFSSLQARGEFISLPVCSGILIPCCGVLLMSSATSRPKACIKITLSALLTG